MKTFTIVALGAALVAAQSFDSLPQCGKTCIGNMNDLAPSLGCSAGDQACLCNNARYGFGIRDCSYEACGNEMLAQQVVSYAATDCASVLAAVSSSGSSLAGSATSVLATGAGAGAASTTGTGSMTGMSSQSSATATKPLLAIITSDGNTETTTTGFTTLYPSSTGIVGGVIGGAGGASSAASTGVTGVAGSASSAANGASSTAESVLTSLASSAASVASSLSTAAAGAATTTSGGAGAVITAAPILGFGMAALAAIVL